MGVPLQPPLPLTNIPSSMSKIFIDLLNKHLTSTICHKVKDTRGNKKRQKKKKDKAPTFKELTMKSAMLVGTNSIVLTDALVILHKGVVNSEKPEI